MDSLLTPEIIAFKREVFESFYSGRCTIYTIEHKENPATGYHEPVKNIVVENEPCRITRQSSRPAQQEKTRLPEEFRDTVNLMIRPEIDIPPGSTMVVTFNGHTYKYRETGDTQMYSDHQTIKMFRTGDNEDYV